MTRYDRLRIKAEAWRDAPELWLALICVAVLLILAYFARR
jgi:hypothetical protein